MTKIEAFKDINKIQDYYIDELISLINNQKSEILKTINFTSPTGTGKTIMMGKLINRFSEYFFIITTLSKGQLQIQIRNNLEKYCKNNNFIVYGCADYRINSKLEAEDIINQIPKDKKCIWLRDEGHIHTNRFDELLADKCFKIINFSATNTYSDIQCNFTQTMMLRTVNQSSGTIDDAIDKLLEVKLAHEEVTNYNPCAIFRCIKENEEDRIIKLCKKHKLKYINITDDDYIMSELCDDANEYDVIINKFKITEGIDIRRCHILYMDSEPSNISTTIQFIGRCRRNALLYRDDIDILAPENSDLLEATRECYVFFKVRNMKVDEDENGELQQAFCNHISCECLNPDTIIDVVDGQLSNGLFVLELENQTGRFEIKKDDITGFNVINPLTDFYKTEVRHIDDNYIYVYPGVKIRKDNLPYLIYHKEYGAYSVSDIYGCSIKCEQGINKDSLDFLLNISNDYYNRLNKIVCSNNSKSRYSIKKMQQEVSDFIKENENQKGYKAFCLYIKNLNKYELDSICSKNEVIILQYHCIQLKKDNISLNNIELQINKYISFKYKYYKINNSGYYIKEIIKNNYCNMFCINDCKKYNWGITSIIVEDIYTYVSKFMKDYYEWTHNKSYKIDKKYKYFCNIINSSKLEESFSTNTVRYIQYECIKKYIQNITIEEINDYISDIINLVQSLKINEGFEDIAYNYLIKGDKNNIYYPELDYNYPKYIEASPDYYENLNISIQNINDFFEKIEVLIQQTENSKYSEFVLVYYVNNIKTIIEEQVWLISNSIIPYATIKNPYIEPLCDYEKELIDNKIVKLNTIMLDTSDISLISYKPYDKIFNDKESAIIGIDLMQQVKRKQGEYKEIVITDWIESRSVTSKINKYTKLNRYISSSYQDELKQAASQYFSGKNDFNMDAKCNSMIGYCVEYYSKYLVYGLSYLDKHIKTVQKEIGEDIINDAVIIRACILKYKEMMNMSFGINTSKYIKSLSLDSLSSNEYKNFVDLVVLLGTKTANYVKKTLYSGTENPINNIDPNLSIQHIAGLADYITEDTILDVKVRNNINEECVRQVLAYHYLSTKRSDLNIKRVIVYDAVSDKSVIIDITRK